MWVLGETSSRCSISDDDDLVIGRTPCPAHNLTEQADIAWLALVGPETDPDFGAGHPGPAGGSGGEGLSPRRTPSTVARLHLSTTLLPFVLNLLVDIVLSEGSRVCSLDRSHLRRPARSQILLDEVLSAKSLSTV